MSVRLMLPARTDSKIVGLTTHSFLDAVLRTGVNVYFYTPGFLHSDLLIVDDDLVMVGSPNLDFRSFEHNFEVTAPFDGNINQVTATLLSASFFLMDSL